MKTKYFLLLLQLLFVTVLLAQQNLEFVENKGQWNKNIQFKGEMSTGSFVLKPDGGYRMLQYSISDLNALQEMMHPHGGSGNDVTGNKKATTAVTERTLTTKNSVQPIPNDLSFTLSGHVYEVKFLNGNPHPDVLPDKPLESYNNYILGNDASKWVGNCAIYTAVTFKNIYPNIDVRYYTDKGDLKYDFIVNPGGDVNNIALYVDGAESITTKKGQLVIKTSVGEVKENIPTCYQFNNITGRKEVACSFKISGNIVRFSVASPTEKNTTLIIDPQFIFSTFTGSSASNWGYTATYDNQGNFYAGGIVFGSGFPVNNGAYQTTFGGGNGATGEEASGFDIGIMKFNPLGTKRVYATYVGGSGNDYPHSLIVDDNFNLIIAGKTTSSNYPATQPHYGPGNANDNNFDIILTKLNAAGTGLVGSMVIGGTANDGVNIANKYPIVNPGAISLRRNYGDDSRSEVIIDSAGNIYIASCTQSIDFRTTDNALQRTRGLNSKVSGRYQDAVIIKTTPDLSTILFSTLLGGDDDDAAFVLAINPITNELIVAGATASDSLPGDRTNVLFPKYSGGICDGFVCIISNDGNNLIHTSYMGTTGADVIYGVQYDKYGYPYIMGTTTGKWPTANANFVQSNAKQFIAKLNKDLSGFVYSTTFGTRNAFSPNISPTAFLVDRCENVYVSGWGGLGNTYPHYPSAGTIGLSITANAIKKTTDGDDFYFFVLERDAVNQLYGSFFGQDGGNYPDHVDGGTSRFDKNGVIYQSVCANCGGGTLFPTSSGAAYPNNGSRECNLAAIKIAFNLAGVGSAVKSSIKGVSNKRSGCIPLTVNFIDTIAEGQKYIWDFGDNSPKQTTKTPTNSHAYNSVGSYLVSLVSIDSSTCNVTDTSYVRIKAGNIEAKINMTAKKIPANDCKSTTYQFNNSSTANQPFSNNSFTLAFGDGTAPQTIGAQVVNHTYPSTGTYNVSLTLNDLTYCNAPDSLPIVLRISQNVKAIIKTDPIGCAPYNAVLENASLGGESFVWDFGDNSAKDSTTAILVNHFYPNIGNYNISLIAVDSSTCNKRDTFYFPLVTKDKPTANFSFTPTTPTANEAIVFTNTSANAVQFKWLFDDGDSLISNNINDIVTHTYNTTKTYRVSLIAFNPSGCTDTLLQDVKAIVIPFAEVANAIAPNGKNRTIKVHSLGIETMKWRIYNRWGQVIFETTNKDEGWDGTFKGQMQAADVYSYTLDITYTNGKEYTTKGDITLLK